MRRNNPLVIAAMLGMLAGAERKPRCEHVWVPDLNETGDRVMAETCGKCGVPRDIAPKEREL